MSEVSDHQLLERFVTRRDEAAFAVLAGRHAALVARICRRVLHDKHDAEDVLQETLLVLARKAAHLPWQPSVGPWLSAVAYRLALSARGTRRRCQEHPCETLLRGREERSERAAAFADPVAEAADREVRSLVRDEVARLPTKYRDPIILCYLEGKTCAQAAHDLGWPIGSMSRRLGKARHLLRERLTCRGLGLLATVVFLALVPLWLGDCLELIGIRCIALPPHTPLQRIRSIAANDHSAVLDAERRHEAGPGSVADTPICVAESPRTVLHAHGQEREKLLRRLTEPPSPEIDLRLVAALADQAERSAGRIEKQAAGRRSGLWRELARDMGASARGLAEAAKLDDRPAMQLAAARLCGVCSHCHQTFRD